MGTGLRHPRRIDMSSERRTQVSAFCEIVEEEPDGVCIGDGFVPNCQKMKFAERPMNECKRIICETQIH